MFFFSLKHRHHQGWYRAPIFSLRGLDRCWSVIPAHSRPSAEGFVPRRIPGAPRKIHISFPPQTTSLSIGSTSPTLRLLFGFYSAQPFHSLISEYPGAVLQAKCSYFFSVLHTWILHRTAEQAGELRLHTV